MNGRDINKFVSLDKEKQFSIIKGDQRRTFTLFECINCCTEEFILCVTYIKKINQLIRG